MVVPSPQYRTQTEPPGGPSRRDNLVSVSSGVVYENAYPAPEDPTPTQGVST